MKKLSVKVDKSYDIIIEKGILKDCGNLVKSVSGAKKIALISDTNVVKIYGELVIRSLENAGFQVVSYVFEAGEQSKT